MTRGEEEKGREGSSNEELLQLAAAGDDEAFGIFCSRVLPQMLGWLRSQCRRHGVPEHLAEDIAQLTLFESIDYIRHKPSTEFTKGLISTIARRRLLKMVREKRRPEMFANIELTDDRSHSSRLSVERSLDIREAFNMLPPKDRDVLNAILYEDKTQKEAADVLGLSAYATSKRYYRALDKLRRYLSDYSDMD